MYVRINYYTLMKKDVNGRAVFATRFGAISQYHWRHMTEIEARY